MVVSPLPRITADDRPTRAGPEPGLTSVQLGRVAHIAFDAVLLSAFLAGVKRSTGLTPSFKSASVSDNTEVKKWVDKYLGVGEWFMDQSIAVMGSSSFFERKRS